MTLREFLLATLLTLGFIAAGPASAVADPFALGTVTGSTTFEIGRSGIKGNFVDQWTFSLGSSANSTAASWVVSTVGTAGNSGKIKVISDINNFTTSLWNADTGSIINMSLDSNGQLVAPLTAGNYYYKVTGTGGKQLGGSYAGILSINPVPEPGELAMMLTGLGLLGVMVRRRSRV
ncbi:MAG: FxDxF family PEP-CTERM protein [Candidatus Pacebacteria bacterium]|nr:FxDxF family PEP-CTERM protein [Candidatus Paceibacterota bacterium]